MFKDKTMSDFTVDVLDQVKAVDLEEYEEFLKVYKSADSSKTETNGERGVKRKISALRSFYAYYYKHEMITTNPSVLIDVPKIHDKNIIRLDTCLLYTSVLNVSGKCTLFCHCECTVSGSDPLCMDPYSERAVLSAVAHHCYSTCSWCTGKFY